MPIKSEILEQLRNNDEHLVSLNLSSCVIADDDAMVLAELLKINNTLKSLDLSINQIGHVGATALAEALSVNKTVTRINLTTNQMGNQGFLALAGVLKSNTSLKHIYLSCNSIQPSSFLALADALKSNKTLTSLDLERVNIETSSAVALADALHVNTSLTTLNLVRTSIDDAAFQVLANAMKSNTTLKSLNLSGNNLDVKGPVVSTLADALKVNTTLISLNLRATLINDEHVKSLAAMLKGNGTLTEINLALNRISDKGAHELAEALQCNRTLKKLDLGSNYITKVKDLDQINSKLLLNSVDLAIKAAWGQSYKNYEHYTDAIESQLEINFSNQAFRALIEAVFRLRNSDGGHVVLLISQVIEKISEYLSSVGHDLEKLPENLYLSEFVRLLTGRANAMNVSDAEAQVMAFAALTQPFNDADLCEEAKSELIGLMNNHYFANLAEGSMQRGALDLLILMMSCQYPDEQDLRRFAIAAYSRLKGEEKINDREILLKLNDREAVQADFEELLTKECGASGWTRTVLREKCIEELTHQFVPDPTQSPSPNPHGLFQPSAVSQSPVAEVKSPQKKAT